MKAHALPKMPKEHINIYDHTSVMYIKVCGRVHTYLLGTFRRACASLIHTSWVCFFYRRMWEVRRLVLYRSLWSKRSGLSRYLSTDLSFLSTGITNNDKERRRGTRGSGDGTDRSIPGTTKPLSAPVAQAQGKLFLQTSSRTVLSQDTGSLLIFDAGARHEHSILSVSCFRTIEIDLNFASLNVKVMHLLCLHKYTYTEIICIKSWQSQAFELYFIKCCYFNSENFISKFHFISVR